MKVISYLILVKLDRVYILYNYLNKKELDMNEN